MPTPEDVAVLLRNLYDGTRHHKLAWTKQDDQTLVLELSDEYLVTLKTDDHLVSLSHRHRLVWSVNRGDTRDLGVFAEWMGKLEQFKDRPFPDAFFSDLWRLALDDTNEGSGHVSAAADLAMRRVVGS